MNRIFYVSLILIGVLIIYSCKSNNDPIEEYITELEQTNQALSSINTLLYGNTFLQYESEDFMMANIAVETINEEKSYLKDWLSNSPKIILRYTKDHCNTCVDEVFVSISENKNISWEQVLIICSYDNMRSLRAFFNTRNIKATILNTEDKIQHPAETIGMPYFMVLQKDMKARMVFVPAKEIKGYTQNYLNIVTRRLINSTLN